MAQRHKKSVVNGTPQEFNPAAKYRVWWIPQVPGKPFYWYVETLTEAKTLIEALAQYDIFQLNQNIKPDFSNAGGLAIFEGKRMTQHAYYSVPANWSDWESEEGRDIDSMTLEECRKVDAAALSATS